MLADGVWGLSGWGILAYTLILTHITVVSVTVYLHRHSAHCVLDLHPSLAHCFRFWLWMTTGMVTCEWIAIHRKHHAKCETEDDPHGPVIQGLANIMLCGVEAYRSEATNEETLTRCGKGCPDDWIERNLYARSSAFGVASMLVVDLMLFGANGATVWAVQIIWIPFLVAGMLNGVGHYRGYRNFACPDAATNILPWGILIGGEELLDALRTWCVRAQESGMSTLREFVEDLKSYSATKLVRA